MTEFEVGRREAGQTLAAVVRVRLGLTWSGAKELIAARRVKLAGQTCADAARRVKAGQAVEVVPEKSKSKPPRPLKSDGSPKLGDDVPKGIVIRHCDETVLVVDKPAGLTTSRDPGEAAEFGARARRFLPKTLADLLPALVADGLPVIPVHRIDRDTSGLVVFARMPEAAKHLGKQFRAHSVSRKYLAVTRGAPPEGTIESWLVRDRGDGRRGSGPAGEGQRAVTRVRVQQEFGSLALVECRLETGRTHQVRIHLGEAGCPLAGERVYDRPVNGAPVPDPSGARRALLHAAVLGFTHPATGERVEWESAAPADFSTAIKRFERSGRSTSAGS